MGIAPAITLSPDQRAALKQRARNRSLPARVVERARIVLFAAEGRQDKKIAATMKITPQKVSRWRKRFLTLGMPGLERDAPPARSFAQDHRQFCAAPGAHDHLPKSAQRNPLEHARHWRQR